MSGEKHALILGASGISGWSLLRQTQRAQSFKRITATTNRPMEYETLQLPRDDRIQLVSGIDFTKPVDHVVGLFKDLVKDCNTFSHVFFCAYIEKPSFDELRDINVKLLDTAVRAIETVSPALEVVILQTGGKAYGVEFSDKISIQPPLHEDLPRIPAPLYDNIFYYPQHDKLLELSKDKKWTFTEVRPDVIIGFVPNDNAMDAARGVALYLSLYRHIYGAGAQVPFPGTKGSFVNKHTDTCQIILADFEIYAALHPEITGEGRIFNVADGDVTTWSSKWPRLCEYFGLKGDGPTHGDTSTIPEFMKEHGSRWDEVVLQHNLRANYVERYSWGFIDFVIRVFDFDRQYSLVASYSTGFDEMIDTVEGWTMAFDKMREAKMIP